MTNPVQPVWAVVEAMTTEERDPLVTALAEVIQNEFDEGEWASLEADALAVRMADALPPQLREWLELGRAWSEAEAALPEGWVIEFGNHDKSVGGYWTQAISPDDGTGHQFEVHNGATPEAALVALTRALSATTESEKP